MARITKLNQRIKTVSMIQKITHAMRLTSMSTHAKLQKKKHYIDNYQESLKEVLTKITPPHEPSNQCCDTKKLIVIVGSQKGLCGVFNTNIIHLFEKKRSSYNTNNNIIIIGKKIHDFFEQHSLVASKKFDTFTSNNFVAIAHEIATEGLKNNYDQIIIYSNNPRTFFIQESKVSTINVPYKKTLQTSTPHTQEFDYEESLDDLIFHVETMHIEATIENILFKSLIAEQAARFISMDNSNRNAENLLHEMKRNYNKLRQATITRELTDLAGDMV